MKKDLGTVYTLLGASILTTYSTSTSLPSGREDAIRFNFETITRLGSAMTGLVVKIQASSDGITFYDVVSTDDSSAMNQLAIEHTFSLAANSTQQNSISLDGGYLYLQVAVKVTGGAGAPGDSVVVKALTL